MNYQTSIESPSLLENEDLEKEIKELNQTIQLLKKYGASTVSIEEIKQKLECAQSKFEDLKKPKLETIQPPESGQKEEEDSTSSKGENEGDDQNFDETLTIPIVQDQILTNIYEDTQQHLPEEQQKEVVKQQQRDEEETNNIQTNLPFKSDNSSYFIMDNKTPELSIQQEKTPECGQKEEEDSTSSKGENEGDDQNFDETLTIPIVQDQILTNIYEDTQQHLPEEQQKEVVKQQQRDEEETNNIQTNLPFKSDNSSYFIMDNKTPELSILQEKMLLKNSLSRSLHSQYDCKILSDPERGKMNGTVIISRPDKQVEKLTFYNECGYRAKVSLNQGGKEIYNGFMYYRAACFNPVRCTAVSEIDVKVKWTPLSKDFENRYQMENTNWTQKVSNKNKIKFMEGICYLQSHFNHPLQRKFDYFLGNGNCRHSQSKLCRRCYKRAKRNEYRKKSSIDQY